MALPKSRFQALWYTDAAQAERTDASQFPFFTVEAKRRSALSV